MNILNIAILAIVLLLALFAYARQVRPAVDQQGQVIHDPAVWPSEPLQLKVATFNIQGGKNLVGKRDITMSAEAVANADIVGLQEVHATGWLNKLGFGESQIEVLARVGQFGYLFAATRRRWFREYRGNAILTKVPVSSWKSRMLPDQTGKKYRNLMIAEISWQGKSVTLLNTHLHTGKGRRQQLNLVLDEFSKHPHAILLGDFNSRADSALLQQAFAHGATDAVAAAGFDADDQTRIDWILTRGFNVAEGHMLEAGISDHPYYEVSLTISN